MCYTYGMPTPKKTLLSPVLIARIVTTILGIIPVAVSAANINFPMGDITKLSSTMTWAIGILHLFTWVAFVFLNAVLDPRFIFDLDASGGGSLMGMLNQIW